MALLAVIPSRGGSKRLPGKNTRPLAGRSALAYTVTAAIESGLFAQIVVSTDSPAIADVARNAGADVPFLRDAELSGDHVHVSAVTLDTLRRLDPDERRFAAVAQLMPNCPLRTADDIRASYEHFTATGAESQISVARFGWQSPWWAMRRADSGSLEPLFEQRITDRSQDLPELFCPTGAVWWVRAETLRRAGTFHTPGRTGWEIPWQRAIDIDTQDDWDLAEMLLAYGAWTEPVHAC